jgi:DNA-directed RNA polymerase sigma subunit (sigma70/sigma32)
MTQEVKQRGRPRLDKDSKISRERVRQIQENALRKLRRLMFARGYKADDFFDTTKQGRG